MFGAGTDYCLLIVSRFRDELRRGDDVEAAMRRARRAHRPGDPRLAAGSSSPRCSCSSLADFNATREMGPILALGIVVMMAAGLTLLPALLAVFGRRAFWPAIPQVEPERGRGERALAADRRARAPPAARCSRSSASRSSRRARSATSKAAATSTSPSSTATRPSPCRARS